MFELILPGLAAVIEFCAAHTDVVEKLGADIAALFRGHPANAAQDAQIAFQAGYAAAKASAIVTVQARAAAAAKAAGAALVQAQPAPALQPTPVHVDITGNGA